VPLLFYGRRVADDFSERYGDLLTGSFVAYAKLSLKK
jgi:hypothetical protein